MSNFSRVLLTTTYNDLLLFDCVIKENAGGLFMRQSGSYRLVFETLSEFSQRTSLTK